MRTDLVSNHKVTMFQYPDRLQAQTLVTTSRDMYHAITTPAGHYEKNRSMLIIMPVHEWGRDGTITITVQHSNDNTTFTTLATLSAASAGAAPTVYIADVHDFRRYVRLSCVIAGGSEGNVYFEFCILGVCAIPNRAPVYQEGTELTVTYA